VVTCDTVENPAQNAQKRPIFPQFLRVCNMSANIHGGFKYCLRHNARMTPIWLGTSGFSYKEWRPTFYPEGLSDKQFLQYYSGRFNSVEIDYTFYRMPSPKTIEGWKASTPEHFKFVLKASQQITHRQRLKVPSEALDYFVSVVPGLESRLGLVSFQLPPFLKCDQQKLETFLSVLPRGLPAAFEFRHESWFTGDVYRLLRDHNVALCIHDADDHTTPMELTAGFTYVRLRRSAYDDTRRMEWQDRMRSWAGHGVEVFAYIKHEDNPDAPLIALEFAKGLTSPDLT
jgi:uncharacterized protein YecE (DUF72 family)